MAEEKETPDLPFTADELAKLVTGLATNQLTLRQVKGLTDAEMETIYAMGVDYYNAGNFTDAGKLFRFLVRMDHFSSRYLTAVGSVEQATKNYDKAIKAYQVAAFYDLHNPRPQFYAAQCFLATGDCKNARSALKAVELLAPKDTAEGKRFRAKGQELLARVVAAEAKKND